MKNYFDVRGRVAFVTGASKGLGKMFADTLGDAGAKLFILATTREPLEAACREFREKGYECECFCGNITDAAAVDEAVRRCVERYGRIDILVNNAAAMRNNKAPEDTSIEEWEHVIHVNVDGAFIVARAVGKVMLRQRYGKIINMSSISGKIINKGVHGGSYDVSKAAVDGLTLALASEWADKGINVNAIAPGYFMTQPNREYFDRDPGFYDLAVSMIPVGRVGEPEQLAGTILYLASPASDYLHGTVIRVDGGYMIW
ncbi:MAG: SDR family oxidoreductase [Clostridia bacterium]|nr:SDR family oxidoreductase [Clostridia bacterium]